MLLDSKNILFENDMGSLYIQATIFHDHRRSLCRSDTSHLNMLPQFPKHQINMKTEYKRNHAYIQVFFVPINL